MKCLNSLQRNSLLRKAQQSPTQGSCPSATKCISHTRQTSEEKKHNIQEETSRPKEKK